MIDHVLTVAVVGLALACVWLWVASLPKFKPSRDGLRFWLKYILPTGVIIAAALAALGVI